MDMINMKINGMDVQVPANYTILQAAEQAGIRIPTLCYLKDVNAIGACRLCVVEVKGARSNPVACLQTVAEGMEVQTNTAAIRESRKKTLELLLSNHRMDCLGCSRSTTASSRPSPRNTSAITTSISSAASSSPTSTIPRSISSATTASASSAAAASPYVSSISMLPSSVPMRAASRPTSPALSRWALRRPAA